MKKREPPYDEFFDRHRGLLYLVLVIGSVLVILSAIGLIAAYAT